MEQIKALPTQDLPGVVGPTLGIYAPLINANATAITSTPKQTYSYGSHERQKLDIYTPKYPSSTASKYKVLIFVYGGGFMQGDRTLPVPPLNNLAYANVGAFFANNYGFSVVVPDYRRIPDPGESKYLDGGRDLEQTINWIATNQDKLGAPSGAEIELYIMGNSAGGVHTATLMLHPEFEKTRQDLLTDAPGEPRLRGIILLSAPFEFPQAMAGLLGSYFGGDLAKNSPLGLLRSLDLPDETPTTAEGGPRTLLLTAELDPQSFHAGRDNFVAEWKNVIGDRAVLDIASIDGHNHISPPLALATGNAKEEEWGRTVAEWILKD